MKRFDLYLAKNRSAGMFERANGRYVEFDEVQEDKKKMIEEIYNEIKITSATTLDSLMSDIFDILKGAYRLVGGDPKKLEKEN